MASSYFRASDSSPDTHKEVTETAWRCEMRHMPRFRRGPLLLHPNKQGSNTLRAPEPTHKTQRDTSTETEKPTQFQRAHNRARDKQRIGPEQPQSTEKKEAKIANTPIPANKAPTSRQSHLPDCEHPSRRTQPTRTLSTHHDAQAPHATTEPSSFTAEPSEPSGPATSKTGQERTAPNRDTAVTWHKEIRFVHNRQRSYTRAQRHIARGAVGQTNETEAREN